MPMPMRHTLALGIAAALSAVACGDDTGGGSSVEVQVIAGIANPGAGYIVRVTTPRTTVREPLHTGDQTSAENWTYFDLSLNEGELVEFAVEDTEGTVLVAETCTVQGAVEAEYARAIVFYFAPPNNYVDCADGFAVDET